MFLRRSLQLALKFIRHVTVTLFAEVSSSFLLDVWSYDKMLHRKRQRTSHRVYQKKELSRQIHMLRVWGKCLRICQPIIHNFTSWNFVMLQFFPLKVNQVTLLLMCHLNGGGILIMFVKQCTKHAQTPIKCGKCGTHEKLLSTFSRDTRLCHLRLRRRECVIWTRSSVTW